MKKVYEDENIKLYRDEEDYEIKTKSLAQEIKYGQCGGYGISFSVEWKQVVSAHAYEGNYSYALAA